MTGDSERIYQLLLSFVKIIRLFRCSQSCTKLFNIWWAEESLLQHTHITNLIEDDSCGRSSR